MFKTLGTLAAITALAYTGQAAAQDSLLEYLVDACEADLTQYCSQVTPGNGRLLHCVAAHEDKLSGQCEYALYQAASLLARRVELEVDDAFRPGVCGVDSALVEILGNDDVTLDDHVSLWNVAGPAILPARDQEQEDQR